MNAARILRIGAVPLLAGLIAHAGADPLFAQINSMFGSRGPAGQIGSNLSGSPVGRSTTLGSTNLGQRGNNNIGFNSFGSPNATMNNANRTGANGQGEFVGRQDAETGRFIGNQRAGQQRTNRTGRSQRSNAFTRRSTNENNFNANNQQLNQRNGNRSATARMNIRPRQRIAFSFPQQTANTIESTLAARFNRMASRIEALRGVTVSSSDEGVVVLSGEVASEDDKRLAALLARLEPGVRAVQNDLVVRAEHN